MSGPYALGIDVGGTFTDVVLAGPEGQVAVAKCLSTPRDPAQGIVTAVGSALAEAGIDGCEIGRVVHATTLATNLILERKGGRIAFLATEGCADLLVLGRYARVEEDRYDLYFDPPEPPVAAEDCFAVPERVDAGGAVVRPLDEATVREIASTIRERAIRSVAVCLLHSYAEPAHERRVAAILTEELPADTTIVISSDIWPERREYERATTTVMSAYVGPVMIGYLRDLGRRLAALGVTAPVQVMESGGGVMSAELAGRRAVATVESGPAAGVVAAQHVGARTGHKDLISFDMGGTTAKACVVLDGYPGITREFHVGGKGSFGGRRAGTGIPIRTPAIDLAEVGAGGGSLAWVDDGGVLHVGPRSAGAEPGPACYGLGGAEPTVTDASLLLGYLDPDSFARGAFRLRADLAVKAMGAAVAEPLGVSPAAAAHAVHEIVNALMGSAVHVVTVQRGIDPRGFALVAMGGAGGMHAARVAERFGIRTVLLPPSSGVGSAAGLLSTDLSTDRSRTLLGGHTTTEIETLFRELTSAAATDLGASPTDPATTVVRTMDLRYRGQAHELTVPAPAGPHRDEHLGDLAQEFGRRYQEAYGVASDDPVEIAALRVRVTRAVPRVPLGLRLSERETGPIGTRPAWFPETDGFTPTPVHDRGRCLPGTVLNGPALVQDGESTVLVPPGWSARVDHDHNLILEAR